MHNICVECGLPQGGCPILGESRTVHTAVLDLVEISLEFHSPSTDDQNVSWCDECFDEADAYERWSWPCRTYVAAAAVLGQQVESPA